MLADRTNENTNEQPGKKASALFFGCNNRKQTQPGLNNDDIPISQNGIQSLGGFQVQHHQGSGSISLSLPQPGPSPSVGLSSLIGIQWLPTALGARGIPCSHPVGEKEIEALYPHPANDTIPPVCQDHPLECHVLFSLSLGS